MINILKFMRNAYNNVYSVCYYVLITLTPLDNYFTKPKNIELMEITNRDKENNEASENNEVSENNEASDNNEASENNKASEIMTN